MTATPASIWMIWWRCNIGVVASDQDGDSATATVNLTVSDDVPTLTVDGQTSVVEGATATGTWSQVIGADQPGASTVVVVGANSYAKIGRASCRERVCQYVSISVVAVALKQKHLSVVQT